MKFRFKSGLPSLCLEMDYCTTARKYGVSDNAIRKWIRAYEGELAQAA